MSRIFILSLILLATTLLWGQQKTQDAASGEIIDGLRTVTLEDVNSGKLTFYRGDYLVIEHQEKDTITFAINELDLTKKYPAPEGEEKYLKLKNIGEFKYTFGDISGKVNIIEYTQPQYKAVSATEAKELIKNLDPLILDVRTPYEHQRGHIKNSVLIPIQVIQRDYTKILEHKDRPVLIYCATGNRSTVAARVLIHHGFKRIYNMRYGIAEWGRSGYEITY